jgi:hypothetical protein
LAVPFVDEPRYGLEGVGTAEKALYVIYFLDEDESLTRPARSLTRR